MLLNTYENINQFLKQNGLKNHNELLTFLLNNGQKTSEIEDLLTKAYFDEVSDMSLEMELLLQEKSFQEDLALFFDKESNKEFLNKLLVSSRELYFLLITEKKFDYANQVAEKLTGELEEKERIALACNILKVSHIEALIYPPIDISYPGVTATLLKDLGLNNYPNHRTIDRLMKTRPEKAFSIYLDTNTLTWRLKREKNTKLNQLNEGVDNLIKNLKKNFNIGGLRKLAIAGAVSAMVGMTMSQAALAGDTVDSKNNNKIELQDFQWDLYTHFSSLGESVNKAIHDDTGYNYCNGGFVSHVNGTNQKNYLLNVGDYTVSVFILLPATQYEDQNAVVDIQVQRVSSDDCPNVNYETATIVANAAQELVNNHLEIDKKLTKDKIRLKTNY